MASSALSRQTGEGTGKEITTLAAIVEEANGPFVLRGVELSAPEPDEVVVKVEASGMCHADLSGRAGGLPFPLPGVLGHEGVGRVVEIGSSVEDIAVGDRVVVSFSYCGHCPSCLNAAPVYCSDWFGLNMAAGARPDGSATLRRSGAPVHGHFFGQSSFSQYLVTAARQTVKVPDDLPASILAPLGCGIQTGVSAVTQVLKPTGGARVAVFGVGAVGMAALMGLGLTGATQIIAVDVHPQRLALAATLGATDTINAAEGNVVERIRELTHGAGLDGAIETSGNMGSLGNAIASLASAGTCVIVGVPAAGVKIGVDVVDMVARGLRVMGTNQGNAVPRVFIPQLIEFYRRGRLPIEKIITDFPFSDINQAAQGSLNGSVIKPILHMG